MKVLMFGWEFPPYISGGLGTACQGICEGLSADEEIHITFVVPRVDENYHTQKFCLIGANTIEISNETKKKLLALGHQYKPVRANITPYGPIAQNIALRIPKEKPIPTPKHSEQNQATLEGWYGHNLLSEVKQYEELAKEIVKTLDFDIIHAHDWLTYPAAIAAKELSKKPLVAHVHATEQDRSGELPNPIIQDIEQKGLDAADEIIAVSEITKKTVAKTYLQAPSKINTIYNAVLPAYKNMNTKLKKWPNKKLVTFVGRVTDQKGPFQFIKAAKLVAKHTKGIHFVMAGEGDLLPKAIQKVASLGLTNRFHFTGFLSKVEVQQLLHLSDLYVLPSKSEPFGISPLEAIQMGVPVIASSNAGITELITSIYTVNYGDHQALANAIYGVLNYPPISNMLKRNASEEAKGLSWDATARKIKTIYNKAIADAEYSKNLKNKSK